MGRGQARGRGRWALPVRFRKALRWPIGMWGRERQGGPRRAHCLSFNKGEAWAERAVTRGLGLLELKREAPVPRSEGPKARLPNLCL